MTKTERAAIAQYVAKIGADAFRVTRNGEVHIKGEMPNSIESGWYFAGTARTILEDIAAGNR